MPKRIKEWYGAKTVYRVFTTLNKKGHKVYEERVIVLRATSFGRAIQVAEKEAKTYAKESECHYLGYVNVFKLSEDSITELTEVFSLMRDSKLTDEKSLDKFFDTGLERTQR
ncbi:MAG: DUF4288 domain-containing protein [Bacteroidetes bacterium]|nr:DUF4288 domain-containing protein [Bacteroidota bacterium]